jgi:hypothetical protein
MAVRMQTRLEMLGIPGMLGGCVGALGGSVEVLGGGAGLWQAAEQSNIAKTTPMRTSLDTVLFIYLLSVRHNLAIKSLVQCHSTFDFLFIFTFVSSFAHQVDHQG